MLTILKFSLGNVNNFNFVNYSTAKAARLLQRLIDRNSKNGNLGKIRTGKLIEEFIPKDDSGKVSNKRLPMLNKAYTQILTDFMVDGKYSSEFEELGLEITNVKLSSNLQTLNIYWVVHKLNVVTQEDLKNLLDTTALELQQHITSFRVTGKPLKVRFVRDLGSQNYLKILELFPVIEEELKEEELKNPPSNEEKVASEISQEYQKNMFGLDRSKIIRRIEAAKIKSKRFDLSPREGSESQRVEKLVSFDKETFAKFYYRKQIFDKKTSKSKNNNKVYAVVETEDDLEEDGDSHEYCFEESDPEQESVWNEDIVVNKDRKGD